VSIGEAEGSCVVFYCSLSLSLLSRDAPPLHSMVSPRLSSFVFFLSLHYMFGNIWKKVSITTAFITIETGRTVEVNKGLDKGSLRVQ
jgi:hypothetical protein